MANVHVGKTHHSTCTRAKHEYSALLGLFPTLDICSAGFKKGSEGSFGMPSQDSTTCDTWSLNATAIVLQW